VRRHGWLDVLLDVLRGWAGLVANGEMLSRMHWMVRCAWAEGGGVGLACIADWNDETSKSNQGQRRMLAVADYGQEDCVPS
jgi:hypothetical protein